jgi:hypothetical protein
MKSSNELMNKKIPLYLVTWIVLLFLVLSLNTCNSKLHYKRALDSERKERLKEIEKE